MLTIRVPALALPVCIGHGSISPVICTSGKDGPPLPLASPSSAALPVMATREKPSKSQFRGMMQCQGSRKGGPYFASLVQVLGMALRYVVDAECRLVSNHHSLGKQNPYVLCRSLHTAWATLVVMPYHIV